MYKFFIKILKYAIRMTKVRDLPNYAYHPKIHYNTHQEPSYN